MSEVERGCLILADISGYMQYMAGVELEHSTDVLADLIEIVVDRMSGLFHLDKLEGDAVFCHAADDGLEGNAVLSALRASYSGFADRREEVVRATTCPCRACRGISDLNLKIVVHAGEYATHEVARSSELMGTDVNLVHRLLKNSVTKQTGIEGYALITDSAINRLGFEPEPMGMVEHIQRYEGVGEVPGHVLDLEHEWRKETERRVVYLSDAEASRIFVIETSLAPSVAWDVLTSPAKTLLWMADRRTQTDPEGALGVGSTVHCVHGRLKFVHHILDWRPYRYLSYRTDTAVGPFICTDEIVALPDGARWRVVHRVRPDGGVVQKVLVSVFAGAGWRDQQKSVDRLDQLLAKLETEAASANTG
jgi:class 3 adenylate cyclase